MLWLDCCAGAVAGCLALALLCGGILGPLTGLPERVLVLVGLANILYACVSFSIASRWIRSARAVRFLVLANACWSLACIWLAAACLDVATTLGVVYLVVEAAFVAFLAGFQSKALHVHAAI